MRWKQGRDSAQTWRVGNPFLTVVTAGYRMGMVSLGYEKLPVHFVRTQGPV